MSKYRFNHSSIYIDGTDVPHNKLNITSSEDIHETENILSTKLAYHQGELIALHPFYELNGRVTRLFCDMLALKNGYRPVDYSGAIDNGAY